MSTDRETLEAANEQRPSMALTTATIAAVAAEYPEWSVTNHRDAATAMVNRGAVSLDGQGNVVVKANPIAAGHVRMFAPRLLGEAAPDDRTPKERRRDRLQATETLFAARIEASRQPRVNHALQVAATMTEAIQSTPALQGMSNAAKNARAKLRAAEWEKVRP